MSENASKQVIQDAMNGYKLVLGLSITMLIAIIIVSLEYIMGW